MVHKMLQNIVDIHLMKISFENLEGKILTSIPKERHAKHRHMITSCESGLKYEWGAFFFFYERKENSRSFIIDVTCSYRMDLS